MTYWSKLGICGSRTTHPPTHSMSVVQQTYKRPPNLKSHLTRKRDARGGCNSKPGTRQGSRTQTAVARRKQADIQVTAGQVFLEETILINVFDFKYLGFTFSADGDFRQAISVRMAQAKARFGQLWQIWGSELPRSAQINLYAAAVIAMLLNTRTPSLACLASYKQSSQISETLQCQLHSQNNRRSS